MSLRFFLFCFVFLNVVILAQRQLRDSWEESLSGVFSWVSCPRLHISNWQQHTCLRLPSYLTEKECQQREHSAVNYSTSYSKLLSHCHIETVKLWTAFHSYMNSYMIMCQKKLILMMLLSSEITICDLHYSKTVSQRPAVTWMMFNHPNNCYKKHLCSISHSKVTEDVWQQNPELWLVPHDTICISRHQNKKVESSRLWHEWSD